MNKDIKILPYVIRFSIAYALLSLCIGTLLTITNIDGNIGTSMAALIGAVMIVVMTFVRKEKRTPTPSERKQLAGLSLIASIVISSAILLLLLVIAGETNTITALPSALAQVGTGLVIGVIAFITVIYGLALWTSYGWLAKTQYKAMERKGLNKLPRCKQTGY